MSYASISKYSPAAPAILRVENTAFPVESVRTTVSPIIVGSGGYGRLCHEPDTPGAELRTGGGPAMTLRPAGPGPAGFFGARSAADWLGATAGRRPASARKASIDGAMRGARDAEAAGALRRAVLQGTAAEPCQGASVRPATPGGSDARRRSALWTPEPARRTATDWAARGCNRS